MRWNVYRSALASGARQVVAERAELVMRLLFYLVILVVFEALWTAATEASGGAIDTYDLAALMWYIAATQAAVIALEPRLIEITGDEIGNGTIAVEMLRPVSVVGFRMAVAVGGGIVRGGSALVVGAAFLLVTVGPPPSAAAGMIGIPSVLLALVANIASQHVFAAAAFWVEDAKGAWFLYQKLVFLLGGMLIPLEFFPSALETASRVLPFWTMAYAPGRLMSGHVEPLLLVGQAAWIVVLVALAVVTFRAGERRMQVVGG